MHKAKVTSKGQITIPAEVREAMGLQPGEKVIFFPEQNGAFIVRRMGSIKDLKGYLAGIEVPKSDEEMSRAIGDYLVELDDVTKSDAATTHAKKKQDGEAA